MIQADKELLLQDLCARLSYKVICKIHYSFNNETTFGEDVEDEADCSLVKIDAQTQTVYLDWIYDWFSIEDVKPYLRPMSSMTEEEKRQYGELCDEDIYALTYVQIVHPSLKYKTSCHRSIDWLNKKMFDYRGLIPMGLALEAPKNMYNLIDK